MCLLGGDITERDVRALIIKAEPVDYGALFRRPEQSRLRVSRLGARRYRAAFKKTEAKPAHGTTNFGILVEAGSEANGIGKNKPRFWQMGPGSPLGRVDFRQAEPSFQSGDCEAVCSFCRQNPQQRRESLGDIHGLMLSGNRGGVLLLQASLHLRVASAHCSVP